MCDDSEVARRVASDFSFFQSDPGRHDDPGDVGIEAYRRAPDYENLPALPAAVYTARNICYPDGDVPYIDYFGRALALYDRRSSRLVAESEHLHLLHEIVFLTVPLEYGSPRARSIHTPARAREASQSDEDQEGTAG